jgi:hypothetical protein
MVKANANTTQPKRYAFGISSFYRVSSGLINDYRTVSARFSPIANNGDVLDGTDAVDLFILEGNGGGLEIVLDGN